jgi:hypothetical protein
MRKGPAAGALGRGATVVQHGRVKVCEQCVSDLLYCDLRDAELCPACDRWIVRACADPTCDYCSARPERPSQCAHEQDRHRELNE